MKEIKLTKGYVAIVDDADFEWLKSFKWYVSIGSGCGSKPYAKRATRKSENRKIRSVFMHREIMNCPNDMVVDHLNSNGLDNRRENLEVVTTKENNMRNIAFMLQTSWGKGALPPDTEVQ